MPLEYENSIAGATDISGAPDPVRTPASLASDTKKRVNQNERRPQAQPKPQSSDNPIEDAGKAVSGAVDTAGQWLQQQGFAKPSQSLSPVDWAQEYEQDASVPWGWARQAAKTLGGSYHDGVNGLYASDDAWAKVARPIAGFLADSIPLVGLQQAAADVMGDVSAMQQGDTSQQSVQKRRQQGEQAAVEDAPGAAIGDLTMALPGSVAGRAASVAVPLLQSLLSGDPDEQGSAMAWAGVGTILSFAHLPEPVKKVLLDRFGDWPAVEKALQGAVQNRRQASRAFQNPNQRGKQVKDWITSQLEGGALPEFSKTVAKAAKPGEAQRVAAEVTPEGAIKLLPSETRAATQKLLKRIGVEDVDELVHKAREGGITDPKAIKGIIKHWKDLGQTYDLRRWRAAETPLRDPRLHLDDVADQQLGQRHVAALNHYLDQIHRGHFANSSNPMQAILRALAGHSRATNLTHQQWMTSTLNLVGKDSVTEEAANKLMQAAEGDQAVYDALRPEEKMVVDGWGLLRAAAREASEGTDYANNFVANWVPRTDRQAEEMLRGRGRPSLTSALARESRMHREEAIQADPQGNLVLGPRFQTVAETNAALRSARQSLIETVTNPSAPFSAELENDPEAKAIRQLVADDPAAAMERAKVMAAQKYPAKEANFLKNANRVFGNQVRAIHTHQALQEFTRMPASGGLNAAVKLRPGADRQREEFLRQGYKQIDDVRFQGFVFHPDLAANLNRYVSHMRDADGFGEQAWQKALQLEGKIVSAIMFAPPVHGLNVAGRMGMAGLMHPLQMLSYLKNGKALLPHQWDDASWQLRSEAYNAGVVPHYRGKNYADNLLSRMQDALGDVEDQLPEATKSDTLKNRLGSMWDNVARPHRWVNQHFWGMVNDFGVMMYHLEKESAQRAGLEPTAAMEWAGRRANSWMGMVAPEDTNPMLHDLSRLVLFAPNWWRTWAELLVPVYKRAGFTSDPKYMKFAATQAAKTTMAAFAFQKMTGNLLNLALSGHLQNENQPGNQDKIEVTAPWIDQVANSPVLPAVFGPSGWLAQQQLGKSPAFNSKTGARRTIENPLARQQLAAETAMGLQSGHRDYQAQDAWDGLSRFTAARFSPLLDSAAAAFNVDMYQSAADHQLRAVNPEQPAGSLSPANLLYTAITMLPSGSDFSRQVQQSAAAGDTTPVESALGTQIPGSFGEAVKDIGDPASRTVFSWLTGTNAPYASAQRSRGIKPSDQDYQRIKQLNDDYHKQMTVLSAESLSGQMTPTQWRQAYVDLSRTHSAQMEALFKNSPEYVNGGEGMAAQWEELYQQATKDDGTLDRDQLAQLQAKFREDHSADQLQQMDLVLHQNDTRFPMLALYHKTQQAFDTWQQNWAVKNNVDVNRLRSEISEYGALYGDSRASQQYLRQHRELSAYERAKNREFERSQDGMMYALFYGNNATVNRYLRANHLTASEFAAEQEGAA